MRGFLEGSKGNLWIVLSHNTGVAVMLFKVG